MLKIEDENKKLHQRNFTKFGLDMNLVVSITSAVFVLFFIAITVILPNRTADFFTSTRLFITGHFNLWFIVILNFTLLFILYLAFSRHGKVVLGGSKSKSDFSSFAWYSMLFSAGIGIGIFFYGIAEPIYHLDIPEALRTNDLFDPFKVMYLHWGLHAWAVYSVVAIAIGYFAYNKGLPVSLRSIFYPVLKEKIYGITGDIIDTIAVLSVLFGLSTSLGLGARQINAGLQFVFGVPFNNGIQLFLILLITFIATLSVVSGLQKGIRFLSEINIKFSFIFLLIILIIGPTLLIFSTLFESVRLYLFDFVKIGTFVATTNVDVEWQSSWTIFYWAWWFSWSPFVGMFIARISKGRTIRQVIVGTVFVPSLVCFSTMTILGASGLYINEQFPGVMETAISNDLSTSLFVMINYLTDSAFVAKGLGIFAVIVIILFFVTSSDSGSLVVDYLTSGGKLETSKKQRVFWATLEGLIAASVLVLGGVQALSTLQAVVIIMGLPFSIMFIVMMYSLIKELRQEHKNNQ